MQEIEAVQERPAHQGEAEGAFARCETLINRPEERKGDESILCGKLLSVSAVARTRSGSRETPQRVRGVIRALETGKVDARSVC